MNSYYACNWAGPFDGCLRIFCRPSVALQELCRQAAELLAGSNIYLIVKHLSLCVEHLNREDLNIGSDFIAQHPLSCAMFEKMTEVAMLRSARRTLVAQQQIANMASGINVVFVIYLSALSPKVGWRYADRQHWERLLHPVWQPRLIRLEDFKPAD